MLNRYVNDRVEMELQDFKAEIEKKYEGSKIQEFKFPRIQKQPSNARQAKSLAPHHHPQQYNVRGHSAENKVSTGNATQNQTQ